MIQFVETIRKGNLVIEGRFMLESIDDVWRHIEASDETSTFQIDGISRLIAGGTKRATALSGVIYRAAVAEPRHDDPPPLREALAQTWIALQTTATIAAGRITEQGTLARVYARLVDGELWCIEVVV